MNTHRCCYLFLLISLSLFVFAPGFAQLPQGSATSATNYYFAKPNELTLIVSVVGFVQRPGRYEISSTVDLVNLMALAGGPTPDGAMNDVKLTRMAEIAGQIRTREYHLNLEEISKLTSNELKLSPGDLIQVDRTGWSSFRDTFTVVVGAAIVTGAVAQVIYATRR
jgi:protein involved in polysaccharide export with SLBB domain